MAARQRATPTAKKSAPKARAALRAVVSSPHDNELFEAKLASSGLTLEDAVELGIELVSDASVIDPHFHATSGLILPYYDLGGERTEFYRLRYLGELPGFAAAIEKPQRYVQAPGTLNWVYVPHFDKINWAEIAKDTTYPLCLTEGELKAAAACKHGYLTLGLGGVTTWQASKKNVPLLPPLDQVEWRGRLVTIVFDSDAATNPNVANAQLHLARQLTLLGASVAVAQLPAAPGGKKNGLDDFLLAGGDFDVILQEAVTTEVSAALLEVNKEYIYISDQDVVMSIGRKVRHKRDSFVNGTLSHRRVINYVDGKGGARKRVELSVPMEWMKWPGRRTVNTLTYEPGNKEFTVNGDYNMWTGWGCEPSPGPIEPWVQLLDFIFKGATPEERRWFEQWCAYPLQHPGTKMFTAAVIWGPEKGTGKSLIGYSLGRIYGKNFGEIGNKELHAEFNEWSIGKQFIMGEEITSTDRRHEADKLKSMITQQTLRVNMKHLPTYEVRDCLNYYFNSNHPDAFFIDDKERRYFIWRVLYAALSQEFYRDTYMSWLNKDGASHLFHYLLNLDLTGFNPSAPAPVTAAKREMVDHGQSDLAAWVSNFTRNSDEELLRLAKLLLLKEPPQLVMSRHMLMLYDPENNKRVTANGLGRELTRAGVCTCGPHVTKALGTQRFYITGNYEFWSRASGEVVREYVDRVYASLAKKER